MSFYNELHRPQFHFSPRENWTNDPNGLVYQDGVWHLFFQHNPEATIWGNMTWGHAVSDDLMHWRQLEHALYPDEHGAMFSGSAVVDHENTAGFGKGALLVFYTAAGSYVEPKRPHTQCLAYSNDNGARWTKYAENPIVEWIEEKTSPYSGQAYHSLSWLLYSRLQEGNFDEAWRLVSIAEQEWKKEDTQTNCRRSAEGLKTTGSAS